MVDRYAASAPEEVRSEAILRFIGALLESGYAAKFAGDVRPINHSSMFRTCGSLGLLYPWHPTKSGSMLMGWFKRVFRPETRSTSYADLRIQSALQIADGTGSVGDVRTTAAMEAVCRLYESRLLGGEGHTVHRGFSGRLRPPGGLRRCVRCSGPVSISTSLSQLSMVSNS